MSNDDPLKILKPLEINFNCHDPHDVFVKDVTTFGREGYADATHVIIGCPQDHGVRRNCGRVGAAKAPQAIREQFYRYKPPGDLDGVKLCDMGDIDTLGELETTHERHYRVVRKMIEDGKKVLVLGGGNDISYPDVRALAKAEGTVNAVNVDAHLDMRHAGEATSGTPYRQLIEDGHLNPERFHEVAIQQHANSPTYLKEAREMGVRICTITTIRRHGWRNFLETLFPVLEKRPFFAGLDMDAIRASDAPGVSAPSPLGLTAWEVMEFAAHARRHDARIFEITETNPDLDIDGRTVRLAARVMLAWLFRLS
ncbi:formimidoylglutamase [Salidesulfovibrio brasiliensis]|uniref:formimidoylglutamase n=1 Tax=Salidesulfovibrio brasiliensis TaxID=221711 RepID=UPI0006D10191|nr:formimidoylglutamase [Salidesulfovibrio brasiliensis]